jgi:spore germination protein GerM
MARRKASPKTQKSPGPGSRRTSVPGSRGRTAYGCLFWLVLLAVVIAVGFAAREPLTRVVARYLGKKTESETRQQPPPPAPPAADRPAQPATQEKPARQQPPAPVPQRQPDAPPALRRTRLYFLEPGGDGASTLAVAERGLPQSDSPLRDALQALLAGPDAKEKARGLSSSIPTGTRLRSVTVKDATAYLDFSESFRFTASGVEGLTAELRQVVATATAFPTVSRVQILIEGRKVQYLGTEGVRVDEPLTAASFGK